jgi:glycolate oxidase iron-sulfur subunit
MSERWLAEVALCARCGKCMSVCPVYTETTNEAMVARGRISLLEALARGEITPDAKLLRYLNSCVKCLRCQAVCPSGVRFDFVAGEGRRLVSSRVSLGLAARIGFRMVLPRRRLFNAFMKLAWLAFGRRHVDQKPVRHLPLLFMKPGPVPRLAWKTALRRFRRRPAPENPRERVGLFLGIEAIVPQGQLCCGAPALGVGDEKAARRLAERNAEAFAEFDRVVVACASCGSTIAKEYEPLLGERGAELAAKVVPFSKYAAELDVAADLKRRSVRTTYHDPCHLRSVQGVWREPRELLAAASEYEEMDLADRCCGQGGVFSFFYPELAEKIAGHKTASIARTRAQVVATTCPGCMMQLAGHLKHADPDRRVRHLAEVIRDALAADSDS